MCRQHNMENTSLLYHTITDAFQNYKIKTYYSYTITQYCYFVALERGLV